MRILSTLLLLFILLALPAPASEPADLRLTEPSYMLDIRFDSQERTIEGSFDLQFVPESRIAYFSLLANLSAEPNPHLAPRQQDAIYPFGFEPARISILSIGHVTEAGEQVLLHRLLAMPPAWQTYSLEDTVLAVDLPETAPNTAITIRIRFITEAPRTTLGDEGITDGILTWRFGWFPMLFPEQSLIIEHEGVIGYEDKQSFPLVFPWSQLAATITIPHGYRLIVGTDIVEEPLARIEPTEPADSENQDDGNGPELRYMVRNLSPSRSLAITIGRDYQSYRIEGPIDVEVFYLPHHERHARVIATLALDILADFEARYGPYPRSSLTIVENPTPHGHAFAADGIVWMSSRFFTHQDVLFPGALARLTEFVLAHEIAHQWVGLGTGIDLDAEAWLSEGLAQYLAVRYFEDRHGSFVPNLFGPQVPGIVGEFVTRQWGFFNLREHMLELPYLLSTRAGFDEELIKPTAQVQFGNAQFERLYAKGYLVARAMAAKVGANIFERALTRAINEKRADLLDVRSFQLLLEEESGQSLDEFFDFWIFGPGSADYTIRILDRSVQEGIHTTIVYVTRDGGVGQPVTVEATMRSGGSVSREWDGVDTESMLEFTTPSRVTRVSIDPYHKIPDRDRLNNHSPVKIVGAVNQNMLPLDAYVLAPDHATGGFVFSHLERLRISISQTAASASIKLDRNQRLSIEASFAALRLSGRISYSYLVYGQPETGSAATFWEPAFALTITGERFITADEPLMTIKLRVTDLPSIVASGTQSVMLRIAPGGIGQMEISARNELRLIPGIYLLGGARIGVSSSDVPRPLLFSIPELRSFSLSPSNHVAAVHVALELPSPADSLPYSLFHLAMIDRVRTRLFLTAGSSWTNLDEFATSSSVMEAGMEQIIELSTLGGLLSMTARIGIATPVLGEGLTAIYGNISF